MTNQRINLNDLIQYATINFISNPISRDDLDMIESIPSELRDELDSIIESSLPSNDLDSMTDADLESIYDYLLPMIESPEFFSRIFDIALARLQN